METIKIIFLDNKWVLLSVALLVFVYVFTWMLFAGAHINNEREDKHGDN